MDKVTNPPPRRPGLARAAVSFHHHDKGQDMYSTPADNELERLARTTVDKHGNILDTCIGYLVQVEDGQLSCDDAWDAILDRISYLDDRLHYEIKRLCFDWEQTTGRREPPTIKGKQ